MPGTGGARGLAITPDGATLLAGMGYTLAVIEATVGQFYIAVIVAVFVGMYATQRRDA